MKYKAVIFDMDGVIFDSENKVIECYEEVAARYGLDKVRETAIKCLGINATVTKQIFLETYGADFPYDTFKGEMSALFHSRYDEGRLPCKPGIEELLIYLKENGYKIGIASSTRYAVVHQEIRDAGLLPYFDHITGGDMLKKSKPEPDIYLMACESLGIEPSEAVAIEDSYNGIRSAYRAGMVPVMVPDIIGPDEEMRELSKVICKDLKEVKKWFANEAQSF